jgi:uncharacterized membrane protein
MESKVQCEGSQFMTQQRDYNVHVRRSITIDKGPEELYRAWRQPENLVRFVAVAKSVDRIDDKRSRWIAEIPGLGVESWTSEIVEDQENRLLSWRTTDNPRIHQEGTVRFVPAPNDLGTEVRLEIKSHIPGGPAASTAAKLVGRSPQDYVSRTLHNFKQLMETGEVATSQGPIGHRRIMTGVAPKVAAAGMSAALFLTTLYLRGRYARGKRWG